MRFPNLPEYHLKQGQIKYLRKPAVVSTVLGSCVSIILLAPAKRMYSICHPMMPTHKHCGKDCPEVGKYVDCVIESMVAHFEKHGARRSEIKAKLFGGSNIMDSNASRQTNRIFQVGINNVSRAAHILFELGIDIVAHDTGGPQGRKLYFNTETGEVLVKKLKK